MSVDKNICSVLYKKILNRYLKEVSFLSERKMIEFYVCYVYVT